MIMVHSLVGCHMPLSREMVLARMMTEGVSQAKTGRKTPCALNFYRPYSYFTVNKSQLSCREGRRQ